VDIKNPLDLLPLAFSAGALGVSFLRSQKIDAAAMATLSARMKASEEHVATMDAEIVEIKAKVNVLPEMNARLAGLDRLVTLRLDRIDKDNDRMESKLDQALSDRARQKT
jgi:hypothetical protein